jgi:hypothetical protein
LINEASACHAVACIYEELARWMTIEPSAPDGELWANFPRDRSSPEACRVLDSGEPPLYARNQAAVVSANS